MAGHPQPGIQRLPGRGRGRGAGPGVELLEELGQGRPCRRVVHGQEDGVDQVVVGDRPVRQLRGLDEQAPGQRRVASLWVPLGERAVRAAPVAQAEELQQRRVGALGAALAVVQRLGAGLIAPAGRPGDRVDDRVQRERAHLTGEQVGVGRPHIGPVGDAIEAQLPVPQRLAQQVQVAGDIGGRHVVQDGAAVPCAGPGDPAVGSDPGALLLGRDREPERCLGGLRLGEGVEAAQRGAAIDAAGVEADQVEAGPQLLGAEEPPERADDVHARLSRTTGTQEERADPAAGLAGGQPDEGQRDPRPIGVVVVQRHPGGGALQALTTVDPDQLGHRRGGRRRRRGGRPAVATGAANSEPSRQITMMVRKRRWCWKSRRAAMGSPESLSRPT